MMKKTFFYLFIFVNFQLFAQSEISLDILVVNEYSLDAISFANVKLVNLSSNQIIRKKSNFNGEVHFDLQPNMKYSLYASAESDSNIVIFNTKNLKFNTTGLQAGQPITSEVKVRPIFQLAGLKFLEDIKFGIFTYNLDKTAKAKLDNIIEMMLKNSEINIEVYGYASCNLGEDDANSVSGERARSTFTYLTDAGIDYTRIKAGAWGKEKSITKCKCVVEKKKDKPCTMKHHLLNSRVSFIFNGLI